MNKINQLINEIQHLKARINHIEEELKQLQAKEINSTSELKIGDKVRVMNKVTIKSNLRKYSSTKVVVKVIDFMECFVKVQFEKRILHPKLKGTKIIRRDTLNLQRVD